MSLKPLTDMEEVPTVTAVAEEPWFSSAQLHFREQSPSCNQDMTEVVPILSTSDRESLKRVWNNVETKISAFHSVLQTEKKARWDDLRTERDNPDRGQGQAVLANVVQGTPKRTRNNENTFSFFDELCNSVPPASFVPSLKLFDRLYPEEAAHGTGSTSISDSLRQHPETGELQNANIGVLRGSTSSAGRVSIEPPSSNAAPAHDAAAQQARCISHGYLPIQPDEIVSTERCTPESWNAGADTLSQMATPTLHQSVWGAHPPSLAQNLTHPTGVDVYRTSERFQPMSYLNGPQGALMDLCEPMIQMPNVIIHPFGVRSNVHMKAPQKSELCLAPVIQNIQNLPPPLYNSYTCHGCSRRIMVTITPKRTCANWNTGRCRKSVCDKCYAALHGVQNIIEETWICPHCDNKCGDLPKPKCSVTKQEQWTNS